MKTKPLIAGGALLVIVAAVLGAISRDILYLDLSVLFFVICIAYANWCDRL
jgi:hypothetical protein